MAKIYGSTTATPIKPDAFAPKVEQELDINSQNAVSGKALTGFYWDFLILQNEVGNIETALDSIIAIQNSLIGGDA